MQMWNQRQILKWVFVGCVSMPHVVNLGLVIRGKKAWVRGIGVMGEIVGVALYLWFGVGAITSFVGAFEVLVFLTVLAVRAFKGLTPSEIWRLKVYICVVGVLTLGSVIEFDKVIWRIHISDYIH